MTTAEKTKRELESETGTWKTLGRPVSLREWLLRPEVMVRLALTVVFLTYVRTVLFDFVFDDHLLILMNPWMESWRSVPHVLTHDLWGFQNFHAAKIYYRPLSLLWLMAIEKLTGGAPGWFHLMSVALLLVVTLEAYVLTRKLLGDWKVAVLAALLFALHPTKVSSVAWISGSASDSLSGVFFFATLLAYLKWRETHRTRWIGWSVAALVVAVLAKETAVLAPVLMAVHWWMNEENPWRKMKEFAAILVPNGAVVCGYLLVRHWVLGSTLSKIPAQWGMMLWTLPTVCWWYVKHLTWPVGLSVYYQRVGVARPTVGNFVLPGVVLVVLAGGILWLCRKSKAALFLYVWFWATLAPVLIMSIVVQLADRYLYLAEYAVAVGVAYTVIHGGEKWITAGWLRTGTAIALVTLCVVGVTKESKYWDDDIALFQEACKVVPMMEQPRLQLAYLYSDQGNLGGAIQELKESEKINPNSVRVWETEGTIYYEHRNFSAARKAFLRAMEVPDVYRAKAASAFNLGLLDLGEKKYKPAETWLRLAIAMEPQSTGLHKTLAIVLRNEGRMQEATEEDAIEAKIQKSRR